MIGGTPDGEPAVVSHDPTMTSNDLPPIPTSTAALRRAKITLAASVVVGAAMVGGAFAYDAQGGGWPLERALATSTTTTSSTTAPTTTTSTTTTPTTTTVPPTTAPPTRTVPSLTGREWTTAMAETGFALLPRFGCFGVAPATIAAQFPAAGTEVAVDATIDVDVQSSACRVFPDVIGDLMPGAHSFDGSPDASERLRSAGFTEWTIVDRGCGTIVDTSPAPGAEVIPDEVEVILVGDGGEFCVG